MSMLLGAPAITALKALGVLTPVRAFDLEFFSPVTWDDELRLEVGVTSVGQHSFSFTVLGYLTHTLAFSASISYVTVSSDLRKKTELPKSLKKALSTGISKQQ